MARRLELHDLTRSRPLALWAGVAAAACLAAGTRADPVVAERTAREVEISLADASFTRMLDYAVCVKGIAERIRLRGADLCARDLAPVVGVPLPLWSNGGSFVVTVMIGIGILLNISMRRHMF